MRWNQGWMLLALTTLKAEINKDNRKYLLDIGHPAHVLLF